jgi:hypothetical protein
VVRPNGLFAGLLLHLTRIVALFVAAALVFDAG